MEIHEVKLGDIATVKGGKRLPKGINLITKPNTHPYIRVRDLNGKRTLELDSSFEFVDDETQKTISRYIVNEGDIVLSIVGTIGLVAVIGKSLNEANLTENCVKLTSLSGVDRDFLYYFLKSSYGQQEITRGTVGAVQAKLPIKNIQDITIPLPDELTQRKIAAVLSSLDAKIETNKKINDNLQQQAQAIYSSMFSDNLDPAWSHGHLSDLIIVKYGKDHKKLADGIYPVYGSGGIMRYVERPLYNKESVLIPRKGTLNNVMYVNQPFWSVDTMFYTEMKLPNVAKFVYHFVKAKDLASMNAGSAVPSMTTDILNAMEVVIPSASALEEFESLIAPMYEAMKANDVQSQTLSKMRDTLLPKLMSGEIDVSAEMCIRDRTHRPFYFRWCQIQFLNQLCLRMERQLLVLFSRQYLQQR